MAEAAAVAMKVDPTPGSSQTPRLADAAHELRQTPGQWKEVKVDVPPFRMHSVAYKINKGRWAAFRPANWFEAKTHEGVLYARFVGQNEKVSA
jgi:hypothetical protein